MKTSNIIQHAALLVSAGMLFTACSSTYEQDTDDYSYYPSSSSSGQSEQYSSEQSGQSEQYQSEQYSSAEQSSIATESSGAQSEGSLQGRDQISIPLHEERLNVGKKTVDAGQVTIRKIVTTETVNQPIQLRKEMLVIDRDSSGSSQRSASASGQSSAEWQPGSQSDSDQELSASARVGSASASVGAERNDANEPAGAFAETSNARSSSTAGDSGNAFQEETFTIRLQEEQPVIEKTIVQTGVVTARKNSEMEQQSVQQQVRREDVRLDRSGAKNVEIRGNFKSASGQINEPSGAERRDSTSQSERLDRTPSQGQGAQDLNQQQQQQKDQQQQSPSESDTQSDQQQQQEQSPE